MVSTRGIRYKFSEGERVLCYEPDPTKAKVLYDSKVLEVIEGKDKRGRRTVEYLIHFQGWNSSWDRCVGEDFVLKDTEENRQLQRDLAEKSQLQLGAYLYRRERKKGAGSNSTPGTAKRSRHGFSDDGGSSTSTQPDEGETGTGSGETSSSSSESDSVPRAACRPTIVLPQALRDRLTFDYHLVVKRGRVSRLPAVPSVAEILESFVKWFARAGAWNPPRARHEAPQRPNIVDVSCKLNLLREVADGLRVYFDFILRGHLLYRQELRQYYEWCGHYPDEEDEDKSSDISSEESPERGAGDTGEEAGLDEDDGVEDVTEDLDDGGEYLADDIPEDLLVEVKVEVKEEVVEDVAEDVVEDAAEDVVEDAAEDVAEDVTEDVAEDVTEDVAEDVTEEVTENVVEDVSQNVVADVSPAETDLMSPKMPEYSHLPPDPDPVTDDTEETTAPEEQNNHQQEIKLEENCVQMQEETNNKSSLEENCIRVKKEADLKMKLEDSDEQNHSNVDNRSSEYCYERQSTSSGGATRRRRPPITAGDSAEHAPPGSPASWSRHQLFNFTRLRSQKSGVSQSENEEPAPSTSTGERRTLDMSSSVDSSGSSMSSHWKPRLPAPAPSPAMPTPLSMLLHKVAKWQLIPREGTENLPCRVYGAIHLARLFVKLPEFLHLTQMSDFKLKLILKYVDMFVQYLDEHSEWFGEMYYTTNNSRSH